ncbi:acyl-CoA dehydrogenase family protein [Rossellomorea sp. LjRoot5]
MPSAEVEFKGANAYLVGEPDRGIYYMMEALNLSRICNAIASIGIMRRAYLEARNYAFHPETFGQPLAHFPMRLMNKHRAHEYFLARMKDELSLVPEEFILLMFP